jgi:glucosylceramidase
VLKTSGNRTLKLFASPWSAPGWMKTNGRMKGGAELRGDFNGIYYLTYARYLREFFIYYYNQGIKFWGMTVQNEPSTGLNPYYSFQTLYLSPSMQRDFVQLRLGPLLKSHWATKDLKIMAHDDDRDDVELAANAFYKYNNTFIDGIGVHWYSNRVSHGVLSRIHEKYPDKFILATEVCSI